VLQGWDPVLDWVRGAGLRPVLDALPAADAAEFEGEYSELLREAYPATSHGTVFPFRRIFAVARKRG
jgi:trans-aconitate 2-methyltransferase